MACYKTPWSGKEGQIHKSTCCIISLDSFDECALLVIKSATGEKIGHVGAEHAQELTTLMGMSRHFVTTQTDIYIYLYDCIMQYTEKDILNYDKCNDGLSFVDYLSPGILVLQ